MPVIRPGTPNRNYVGLQYLGKLPVTAKFNSDVKYSMSINRFTKYMGDHMYPLKEHAGDEYVVVKPTLASMNTVIKKWDTRNPVNYNDKFHWYGFTYLHMQYGSLCYDPIAHSEEISEYVNWTTSGGFPSNMFRFNNRLELQQDPNYQEWEEKEVSTLESNFGPAVYTASNKIEFKKRVEVVEDNKMRKFQIPPHHLLKMQLKFGKRISLRMKGYKWSAYGFNPYSGGVHKLALALLQKRIRLIYDVSGWDMLLPILNDVHKFITAHNGFEDFSELEKLQYAWMVENTVNHIIKLFDGDVVRKCYGNPSGSGTTTRDNILAHVVIVASLLAKAYYDKFGMLPSQELLNRQVVQLFGDDSILGLDEEFDSVLKEGFIAEHFKSYGMTLKFLKGGYDHPLEDLTFLGFSFVKIKGFWYPKYDTIRLATAAVYNSPNNKTREAFITRLFILTLMSFASEEYCLFKRALLEVSRTMPRDSLTPTEDYFLTLAPNIDLMVSGIYQGLESVLDKSFLPFLDMSWWMEEQNDVGSSCLKSRETFTKVCS